MVRHLAQPEHTHLVAGRYRAEDGEEHQVIAGVVENDGSVDGSLVSVVDNATAEMSVPSLHGFPVAGLWTCRHRKVGNLSGQFQMGGSPVLLRLSCCLSIAYAKVPGCFSPGIFL